MGTASRRRYLVHVEVGVADDADDDLAQERRVQHGDAVADRVDEVLVAVLVDDGGVV